MKALETKAEKATAAMKRHREAKIEKVKGEEQRHKDIMKAIEEDLQL